MRPLHPHAVHRTGETGATRIERMGSARKRVGQGACVRACVRACVLACMRPEYSLRVRSCTVAVCSAYICVFAWCVYARA